MLEQNVFRLMMFLGGFLICAAIFTLLSVKFPEIKEALRIFFSQRITKY